MSKNLPANLNDLTNGLANVQQFAQSAAADIVTYVKMGKDGTWTHGTDELEIEPESTWAVNPSSFETGYSAFDANGARVGEEMRGMNEPPLHVNDLPPVGAPWLPQIGFQVCCLSGEDNGLQGMINQRSRGGMSESTKLLSQIIDRVQKGDPNVVAVVHLRNSSYKHSKYGKIFTPVYEIVEWLPLDASEPTPQIEPETEPAPEPEKPKRTRTRKPAAKTEPEPEPEPAAEEPTPVRRRRRRAS